ncbi:MAG: hypothetical protein ABIZ56_07205, partial [Chthoniobacteraceae bacterium]
SRAERDSLPTAARRVVAEAASNSEFGNRNEEATYPWESAQADLAAARTLIEKHGYWCLKEELEDAEAAL